MKLRILLRAALGLALLTAPAPTHAAVLTMDGYESGGLPSLEATNSVYPQTDTPADFTVEAWVHVDITAYEQITVASDDAYEFDVVSDANSAFFGIILYMWDSDGVGSGQYYWPLGSDTWRSGWRHISAAFDATAHKVYYSLDGKVVTNTAAFATLWSDPAENFQVGPFLARSASGVTGAFVDEVRVSDCVRYRTRFSPPYTLAADPNTRALYHFSGPAGRLVSPVADASSHHVDLFPKDAGDYHLYLSNEPRPGDDLSLRLSAAGAGSLQLILNNSIPNATYKLLQTEDLGSNQWTDAATLYGSNGISTRLLPKSASKSFYRLADY